MTSPLQQKLKIKGPVVITANRLRDGAVVYRTDAGEWSSELAEAAVTTDVERAKVLLVESLADGVRAVDPYVAPVALADGHAVLPGNLRERIRRAGPTFALPGA